MTLLIIGILALIGIHLVPVSPALRDGLIERLGLAGYRAAFSVVSTLGLILLIYGFAHAPYVGVWTPPSWTRHIAMLLMLPVFPLLLAAYLPGEIKAKLLHPMLIAIKLWALAHLLANGDLASMILFGSFLAYAGYDRFALKHRPGGEAAFVPDPATARRNDIIAVAGGLALYVVFLVWLHPLLIGVPVLRQ